MIGLEQHMATIVAVTLGPLAAVQQFLFAIRSTVLEAFLITSVRQRPDFWRGVDVPRF